MHRSLFVTIVWLIAALSANAASVEIPVTPNDLDHYHYLFAVSMNTNRNGVAFRVTITAKTHEIPAGSSANVSIVTHTKRNGGELHKLEKVKPPVRIALKKDKRVWKANFTVSTELLKKPGVCFVFTEMAHAIENGKDVAVPSADFYEIKLQDFWKQ